MSGFNNRTGDVREERTLAVWETTAAAVFTAEINAPDPSSKVWAIGVPVKSNRVTMLMVDVYFDCGRGAEPKVRAGYKTWFVVEWAGWNTMYFTAASLEKIGKPKGLHQVERIRMEARDATFGGAVLELGQVIWREDSPLIQVTPYEDMMVNFLSERMWDRNDWEECGQASLPAEDHGLDVAWMYANLWYVQKPGRAHRTAYTRRMNVDIRPYQAISVFTATDVRANFSVILDIDGASVRAIDRRRGISGGDEIRAGISGQELRSVTIELEQADKEIVEAIDAKVLSSIRWILLEKKGTDPASVGQVRGMPLVPPPAKVEDLITGILPVGILIGRQEFLELREAARKPGPLKRMADEIIAEAESHLTYVPERYVGRYLPVDLGNQGCERKASPSDQMYHFNSCMLYGAVAYALTGDRRYGQIARRALFSTVRCDNWQGGFPSRIPSGLPGYRAPFIETDTAEVVAQCYDFIHHLLSEAERTEVEDALYTKALPWIDMYLRLHGEGYLLTSNQGAVYTAGLVHSALVARRSHPDVDAILERAIRWFPRMMNNYYQKDGSSNEGPGYWEFTTKYAVSALIAICRHKKWRVRDYAPAHLGRTMEYMMHLRSLAKDRLSFLPLGDNIERVGYNFMSSSFLFFARYYEDRNALWLWHEYYGRRPNPPGSPFFGKRTAGAYASSGLMNFLLLADGAPARPQLEQSMRFKVCDRITLRTGCEFGDILFFFEGGSQSFQHSHCDKGQFILEAFGERLAADPGVIKYQDPAHLLYKRTSYHNLVTVNGKDQNYKDPKRAVILGKYTPGPQFDFLSADLANSYKELIKYRRRILFVRPDYFLVLDEIQSEEPGLEWNFHSGVAIREADLPSGIVRLEGKKAGMIMAVGCTCALESSTGSFSEDGEVITHNLVLSQKEKSRSMTLAALLLPYPLNGRDAVAEREVPRVQVEKRQNLVSYTVTGRWGSDQVICNLDRGDASGAGHQVIQVWRNKGMHEEPAFEVAD